VHDYIYFDHAATTSVHPAVVEAMLPFFHVTYGNPSSVHHFGRAAKTALDEARVGVAGVLGCAARELVFTSGGTESNNLALFGTLQALAANPATAAKRHLITTAIEHQAVLHAFQRLAKQGYEVTYVQPDECGAVSVDAVLAAVRTDTALLSVMYGNNEVGTLQPVRELGEWTRTREIVFHVDAVQALGNAEWNVHELGADMVAVSAHKIRGPKGIGALYVRQGLAVEPLLVGGSQERKRRAGTENVALAVGFAHAANLAQAQLLQKRTWTESLRRLMLDELTRAGVEFTRNGHPQHHLPHILNLSFPGIATQTMLMHLDLAGIAASSGSACSAGSLEPSHVLRAMRLPEPMLQSAIRFSFNLDNHSEEILKTVKNIETIFQRVRNK
jgi:cysteine desulfurase